MKGKGGGGVSDLTPAPKHGREPARAVGRVRAHLGHAASRHPNRCLRTALSGRFSRSGKAVHILHKVGIAFILTGSGCCLVAWPMRRRGTESQTIQTRTSKAPGQQTTPPVCSRQRHTVFSGDTVPGLGTGRGRLQSDTCERKPPPRSGAGPGHRRDQLVPLAWTQATREGPPGSALASPGAPRR